MASPDRRRPGAVWRLLHRASTRVDAAYQVFDVLRSELLVAAVPPEQWEELTRVSYDRNQLFRSDAHNGRLYDWERRAIERFFPPAPARILVGGAGAGREVRGLLALGYRVAAFDPAGDLVRHGRETIDSEDLLAYATGGYEALVEDGCGLSQHAPFDAVILGWGSFSHIAEPSCRDRLPHALAKLCPDGPVLVSWIAAKPTGRLRGTLRAALAALPGLRRNDGSASYRPHMGFVVSHTAASLAALARAADYRVAHVDPNVPCAVWARTAGEPARRD